MDPITALRRIAFLLERQLAPSYRVQAFRRAADIASAIPPDELKELSVSSRLRSLKGIGESTERVISEALSGGIPEYLERLESEQQPVFEAGSELRAALRGDCHTHSIWSDGGSPIEEMARTAREIGHEYLVLTDHSPNLTVANGLTAERLLRQLEEVASINDVFEAEAAAGSPPFRILTGIEVDILEDGSLDQDAELLASLDLVVASVHSKLRSDSPTMTRRMLSALEDPNLDILGHCTGRRVMGGRVRPPSTFDAASVFRACVEVGVAVEINSRPERKDPPMELLRLAEETGCTFAIDTDAHAPGQLDWQMIGCDRAERAGISSERVLNSLSADDLVKAVSKR